MTIAILPGATSQSLEFKAIDNTTGLAATTLTSATAGLSISYQVGIGTVTAISLSDLAATNSAYSSGGIKHLGGGVYRIDVPDAAIPATEGARSKVFGTATAFQILGFSMVGKPVEVVSASLVTAIWAAVTDSAGVTTLLSRLSSARAGYLDNLSAGAVATASALASLVTTVAGIVTTLSTMVADVWAYATRTLTQSAASVAAAVAGSTITARRGDTLTAALTGLGNISTRTALWVTVKADPSGDADTAAKVQITEAVGLVYLNGAAATAGQGSVTVTNATTGALTIVVAAAATAQLAAPSTWTYDVQWKDASGLIHTLTEGTFRVVSDVTRATA